ncbi:MAG: flagellar hook protein FlgE [bacterium]|nr:flagellar hook protein FlgE [bacterium]
MLRSMFSGVAGMNNNQVWLDIIGNNIANVNTVGYKTGRVTFEDMLNQTLEGASKPSPERGGTNAKQVGLGSAVASMQTVHTQGSMQSTGKNMDLAIQGDGFFVLKQGEKEVEYYTRNGSFGLDSERNLVSLSNGYYVQGYTGKITEGVMELGDTIQNIKITEEMKTMAPSATNILTLEGNLNAQSKLAISNVSTTVARAGVSQEIVFRFKHLFDPNNPTKNYYKWEALKAEDNTLLNATDGQGVLEVDSDGKFLKSYTTAGWDANNDGILETGEIGAIAHGGTFSFTKSGQTFNIGVPRDANAPAAISFTPVAGEGEAVKAVLNKTYEYQHMASEGVYDSLGKAHTVPMVFERIETNTWRWYSNNPLESGKIAGYGTLTFKSNGSLDDPKIYESPSDPAAAGSKYKGIYFDPINPGSTPPATNGASPLKIVLDFSKIVQYATQSSTADIATQNGVPSGNLDGIKVNSEGKIVGEYSNGRERELAQIILANFPNPSGLTKEKGTMFRESGNSGTGVKEAVGKRGRSSLLAGTLEMSNVDLTQEFTNMIIAQRAFSANARIITTSDQMIQEVTALKR